MAQRKHNTASSDPKNLRVVSFRVGRSHADFHTAYTHCFQARQLRNTLVAVSRESNNYRKWSDDSKSRANTSISDSVGAECSKFVRSDPCLTTPYAYANLLPEVASQQELTLPKKCQQRVGVMVARSWKSFYGNPSKDGRAPGYTRTLFTVEYTSQALSLRALRRGRIVPSGWSCGFKLPEHISVECVQSARVVPKSIHEFELEVIYVHSLKSVSVDRKPVVAGIDLGVNVLAAVAFSDHREAILVNGKPLKATNAFYNKKIAEHRSVVDNQTANVSRRLNGDTKKGEPEYIYPFDVGNAKVQTLWNRRARKIAHYLHTVSTQLTAELVSAGVGHVVIGWSPGFKSKMNLGRKTNQKFALIPHRRFVDELTRKLTEAGITVTEQEESYTSKASFLDGDDIPTFHKNTKGSFTFSGTRTKRGLYRSASGAVIHADVNGAYNIVRKSGHAIEIPDKEFDTGTVVVPARRLKPSGYTPRRTSM